MTTKTSVSKIVKWKSTLAVPLAKKLKKLPSSLAEVNKKTINKLFQDLFPGIVADFDQQVLFLEKTNSTAERIKLAKFHSKEIVRLAHAIGLEYTDEDTIYDLCKEIKAFFLEEEEEPDEITETITLEKFVPMWKPDFTYEEIPFEDLKQYLAILDLPVFNDLVKQIEETEDKTKPLQKLYTTLKHYDAQALLTEVQLEETIRDYNEVFVQKMTPLPRCQDPCYKSLKPELIVQLSMVKSIWSEEANIDIDPKTCTVEFLCEQLETKDNVVYEDRVDTLVAEWKPRIRSWDDLDHYELVQYASSRHLATTGTKKQLIKRIDKINPVVVPSNYWSDLEEPTIVKIALARFPELFAKGWEQTSVTSLAQFIENYDNGLIGLIKENVLAATKQLRRDVASLKSKFRDFVKTQSVKNVDKIVGNLNFYFMYKKNPTSFLSWINTTTNISATTWQEALLALRYQVMDVPSLHAVATSCLGFSNQDPETKLQTFVPKHEVIQFLITNHEQLRFRIRPNAIHLSTKAMVKLAWVQTNFQVTGMRNFQFFDLAKSLSRIENFKISKILLYERNSAGLKDIVVVKKAATDEAGPAGKKPRYA